MQTETREEEALAHLTRRVEASLGNLHNTWYDQTTLRRFLAARRFDVDAAFAQFSATNTWRQEIQLDEKYWTTGEDRIRLARQVYTRFVGRRDRLGRPLFVYKPSEVTLSEFSKVSPKEQLEVVAVLMEHLPRLYFPMAEALTNQDEPHANRRITDSMSIIDLGGLSLRQSWAMRNHLGLASKLNSAHYPETLGTLVIVNTPSYFSAIWNWIQAWLDPGTQKKIIVLPSASSAPEKLRDLIAPEDLPKAYGGELDWSFTSEPNLDSRWRTLLGVDQMPDAPAMFRGGHLRLRHEATQSSPILLATAA